MKTERSIFIAFILNLCFSLFELIGGLYTGSIAIISDSVHDLGDAVSIGISYFLERKSLREADDMYTYGYKRFSLLGAFITTAVLIAGSVAVICGSAVRLFRPAEVNYSGMLIFAVVGAAVNFAAAYVTGHSSSANGRAVNLHMLEDVLGWLAVLVGAVLIGLTKLSVIDPLLSIGIAVFIFCEALKNLRGIGDVFLMKTPEHIDIPRVRADILAVGGVTGISDMRIINIDGESCHAVLKLSVSGVPAAEAKKAAADILASHGIDCPVIEIEPHS